MSIRLKFKDQALAVKRKQKELKSKLDKHTSALSGLSTEEVAKKIEKKFSKSHRIRENMSVVGFSNEALSNLSHFSSIPFGFMWILLMAFVMVFPTTTKELDPTALLINLVIVFVTVFLAEVAVFAIMAVAGSKTKFKVYFYVINTVLALSILIVSLPIAIVTFAIFQTMIKSESAVSMFFTLIPFYNYLVWGWANETLAQFKGWRSIIFALLTLLIILGAHLLLPLIML
ncbi:TPA: hypothetical protein HA265_07995 [Candidatus Woesearchaeota archaeon]|nr:hypothetical protein [Candidatus Woesearchaeota archaeon]